MPALALALALAGVGCGKSVVPGAAFDQPLLRFGGFIAPSGATAQRRHPRVSLLWTDPFQRQPDVPMPARYLRSEVDAAADHYTLDLFRPPPAEAMVDVAAPSGETATLALGEIVMFDDENQDGTFTVHGPRAEIGAPDLFLAGSSVIVRYVAHAYAQPQPAFPLGFAATTGYELVAVNCVERESPKPPMPRFIEPFDRASASLTVQASRAFPEVRNCMRTHTP